MLEKIRRFLVLGLRPNTKLYLSGVPLVLLASVGSFVSPGDFERSLWYLLANLISLAFVALVYLFGERLLGLLDLHNRETGRLSFVIASLIGFGLSLGLTKQLSTAWSLAVFNLETDFASNLLVRALTPLLGVWYVLALAAITATQARLQSLREEIIAERVRVLSAEQADSKELEEFASKAQELLAKASSEDAVSVASLIRSIVEDQLRPLSHRLWDREQLRVPGFSSRELAIRALQYRPYRILRILAVFSLGSITPMVLLAKEQWMLAFIVLNFCTFSVLAFANFVRKRSDFAKERFVLSLVLSTVFSTSISFSVLEILGFHSSVILWLSSAWWLGTLMVVVGMFVVALEDYSQQRKLLAVVSDHEISLAAMGSVNAIRNRELASLLHAKTQNKMLAQAMRLEAGGDLSAELSELRSLLAALPSQRGEVLSATDLAVRWEGILEIEFELASEPNQLVLQVIEEAISNANRHGLATEVRVKFDGNQLSVIDNGLGPVSGKPGLGSSLYSSAGKWELGAIDTGGASLTVKLG